MSFRSAGSKLMFWGHTSSPYNIFTGKQESKKKHADLSTVLMTSSEGDAAFVKDYNLS